MSSADRFRLLANSHIEAVPAVAAESGCAGFAPSWATRPLIRFGQLDRDLPETQLHGPVCVMDDVFGGQGDDPAERPGVDQDQAAGDSVT